MSCHQSVALRRGLNSHVGQTLNAFGRFKAGFLPWFLGGFEVGSLGVGIAKRCKRGVNAIVYVRGRWFSVNCKYAVTGTCVQNLHRS